MDLVDADNEVIVVDDEDIMVAGDEEVFYVCNSWFDAGVNSLVLR
jgi:hypothetical protein